MVGFEATRGSAVAFGATFAADDAGAAGAVFPTKGFMPTGIFIEDAFAAAPDATGGLATEGKSSSRLRFRPPFVGSAAMLGFAFSYI
jgi:hypothetical protein